MAAKLGPKADNLHRLQQAGFNVPSFYVLPSIVSNKIGNAKAQSALIKEFNAWKQETGVQSVAVRSSSTQEDGADSSFAGQFTTFLDVQSSDEFIAALRDVFSSKPSAAYAKSDGAVNAIVQEFIEPDISGVIFSVNPANGNNEFVINAAQARGTNVVDGGEAEQYFVSRLDRRSYNVIGSTSRSGILSAQNIKELTAELVKIESIFAQPQDVEWAIKDGVLYVLQARPITRISHLKVWDSSNISESFPGIVLPLTFSIARKGYLLGYKAQAYSGGLSWYELEKHHREFDSMIGIFNGRMYYNLLNWYKIISLFPGSQRNQRFLDDQIATQGSAVYQAPSHHPLSFKLRYAIRILYRTIFFRFELNKFYSRYTHFESDMTSLVSDGTAELLIQRYSRIEQTIVPHFGRTLDNDFFVMTYHGILKRSLDKWLEDKPFERISMIGSVSGVLSAEQALSLYRLAADISSDKTAAALLSAASYDKLDSYLLGTPLANKIADYIKVFGHRFAEDQKLEAVNPTLEPHGLYKLLQAYIKLDAKEVKKRIAASSSHTKDTESSIKKRLRPLQRLLYVLLLQRLKHHLRLRERNRLLRGKTYGYMRELFPKVGKALMQQGALKAWDDIYYLEIEEIYQLIQGTLITNDLQLRIGRRRKAYAQFSNLDMPERFITTALPSYDNSQSSSALSPEKSVGRVLTGLISSPGTVEGRVIVLKEPRIPDEPYDILVASHTDPGWTPLIALAKGVIVEHGGMLSHAAIVTRELGIPSIIGVSGATSALKTGMKVRINAQTASVDILKS